QHVVRLLKCTRRNVAVGTEPVSYIIRTSRPPGKGLRDRSGTLSYNTRGGCTCSGCQGRPGSALFFGPAAGPFATHFQAPQGVEGLSVSDFRSTTILAVRHNSRVAVGGDGQVTLGAVVMKSDAHKIRRLHGGKVVVGFAGASADAFALLERFEAKLKDFQGSVPRAATELAKDWRMDRALRRLEAMIVVVDRDSLLLL